MEFRLDEFTGAVSRFAARHWTPSLPEIAYQHILFHELSELYPDQILAEMLVSVETVREALDFSGQAIIAKYFKKKSGFAPDLTILDQTLQMSTDLSLNTISKFPDGIKLAAFIELKATSSAPNRGKQSYMSDTAKLQLLSDYWYRTRSFRPAAVQVILNWKGGSHDILPPETLQKWFSGKEVGSFRNVHVLRFGADGQCDRLLTPEL